MTIEPVSPALCTYVDAGIHCTQQAVAALTIRIADETVTTINQMDLCTIHLMTSIMRNGIPAYEAVQVASAVGERIAQAILHDEDHRERTAP